MQKVTATPSRKVHRVTTKLVLGNEYDEVHRLLDVASKFTGKKHRKYFHDPISAMTAGASVAGERGAMAALLHLQIDSLCSKDPKLKKVLEMLANVK